jgi:ABC-2 type transport system permease protein
VYFLLFRAAPVMLVGQLMFGLRWPSSPQVWLAFAASTALAIVISFGWRFLINLSAFWLTDARGIGAVAFTAVYFLSGLVIPLRFLPDWVRGVALALPFAGILQTPADLFLERTAGADLLPALALQAFWAVALLGAAQLGVTVATRRVEIQGG